MAKFYLLALALCALFSPAFSQDEHSFQWRYETEDGANIIQLDVLPLADRGYACSGLIESPVGSALYRPYLCRLDCQGKVLWAKAFNQSTESANNTSGKVLQLPEGDFVLVGNVGFYFTTPRNDIFLARVDGAGNTVWTRRIGGGSNNQDLAQAAILSTDGNIVLAGQTGSWGTDAGSNNNYTDQYFLKISPAGNILWTRTVGNPQKVDRAFDLVELPDQSLVAAGSYIHTGGTFYANLLKLDKNGTVLWHKAFGEGTAPQANHAFGLAATSDGGLLLTGSSTNLQPNFQGYDDFLVVKTDGEGQRQWSRVVSGGAPDLFENASSAVELPNGDFAVMCATSSFPTVGFVGNKYAVLRLTPSGSMVSLKTYNAGSSHYPNIRLHPQEGGYLISGFSNWTGYGGNGNRFDPLLINLDSSLETDCFMNDYTAFTTLFDPAFDTPDTVPGVTGVGGTVLNSLVDVSSFSLLQDVVCETKPYETCAPFTGTEETATAPQGFEVWPNPASAGSPISLRWENALVERVNIFDIHGRLVSQHRPVPGMSNLDTRIEQAGVYLVQLQGAGKSRVERVVLR